MRRAPHGNGGDHPVVPPPVSAFRALLSPQGRRLLEAIGPYDEANALAVAERLRREGADAALVSAALTQARLRRRGEAKFGALAGRMFFTADGVEQATRAVVAARHAQRYARAGCTRVADLCCGIGSELLALAGAGLHATGVDRDALTCAVAEANLDALGCADRVEVRCADVTSADLDLASADGWFIDPARRTAGGRTFNPRDYSPSYDFVIDLAARFAATGAKLAPGIPHEALPRDAEAEWVSDERAVVECALWFGPLSSRVRRRATVLPSGATLTGDATRRADVGDVCRYIYEPDGAVIRAGLVAEAADVVGGTLVDPTIAYVTADRLVHTPFCRAYEVTDVLPFQLKKLRALLQTRGVGRLTIKKRGSAIEPEVLRKQLRLRGDDAATIIVTRVAGDPTVLVVNPVLADPVHISTTTT